MRGRARQPSSTSSPPAPHPASPPGVLDDLAVTTNPPDGDPARQRLRLARARDHDVHRLGSARSRARSTRPALLERLSLVRRTIRRPCPRTAIHVRQDDGSWTPRLRAHRPRRAVEPRPLRLLERGGEPGARRACGPTRPRRAGSCWIASALSDACLRPGAARQPSCSPCVLIPRTRANPADRAGVSPPSIQGFPARAGRASSILLCAALASGGAVALRASALSVHGVSSTPSVSRTWTRSRARKIWRS